MNQTQILLLCICGAFFLVVALIAAIGDHYSLKGIPNKPVGNGQHGTARFATNGEITKTYKHLPYTPKLWRKGEQLPSVDGLIVGCHETVGGMTALVDDADIHTLMIGASGVSKTANFLYPNIEYCCAAGMSFVTTDSKGDLYRNTATIAEKYYGYKISVIDLRNPTRSSGYNMLYLVNKYMDAYKSEGKLEYKAKSEKFAKITAKTIISADGNVSNMGQNAFFYEAAEGLLTAVILLIAEFCPPEKRHIISVFKLIQDLLAPSGTKGVSRFQMLIDKLPSEHKARWFVGAALNSSDQAMVSVMSTALSRLNSFIDSELEQILCFDTSIDVEEFCNHKSAIYLVLPEEDSTKHFLISLIFQQLYREILTVADEKGGQLEKRVMFYMDEIGTLPKVDGLEMIFSASRSRKVSIVAIIQSLAQFEKTYGKEGAEIIVDNCQCTLFGAFAPNSKTAETMSQNLGKQTVLSGSVSRSASKDGSSRSLQMIERPLMTVDDKLIDGEPSDYQPSYSAFKVGWGDGDSYTNGNYNAFIDGMINHYNGVEQSEYACGSNLSEGFSFTQDNMDTMLNSDIAYISGHGYFDGVIPIYSFEKGYLGLFIANNNIKNSQFHMQHDVAPDKKYSFKQDENENVEDSKLQWLITAACSQLNNYIDKDDNGNLRQDMVFDGKYTYEIWLDTLLSNPNMKGILDYHFTAPDSDDKANDASIIKEFLENENKSIYDAWVKANSYWLFDIKKTNAALLVKGDYDKCTLSESVSDNKEVTFKNVYLYTLKTLDNKKEEVYTTEQNTAMQLLSSYSGIDEDDLILSEVFKDEYDINGNYISSEIAEYIAAPIQNMVSSYSLVSNNDSMIYRYNPASRELSCIK